jgi:glycosyltransferase involved in cell wall biosynthesis
MLSVIIPTLNAQSSLESLLVQIEGQVDDVVIADGGSTDATLKVAIGHKARIAAGGAGRGHQLARGADWSLARGGDGWMLFLHADCVLPDGWREAVAAHIVSASERAAYFRFALDDSGFWPALMERIVAVRCAVFALPYGDQGLLISRALYEDIGGYRKWDLFEDVAIVRALGRGRLRGLKLALKTDASKYRAPKSHGGGYVRRPVKNIGRLLTFLVTGNSKKAGRGYR